MAQNTKGHVKVIHKSHQFVESDLRLVLLNKDKKFEDDAISRFCCSVRWLNRFAQVETKKKKKKKTHGNRFNNNIDREYLSVNNNNRIIGLNLNVTILNSLQLKY